MKKILSYLKSAPRNLSSCKVLRKTKIAKLTSNNTYLVIFGEGFEETIVILEISTLNFLKFQKFVKKG